MSSDLVLYSYEVLCVKWFLELFSLTGQYTPGWRLVSVAMWKQGPITY